MDRHKDHQGCLTDSPFHLFEWSREKERLQKEVLNHVEGEDLESVLVK